RRPVGFCIEQYIPDVSRDVVGPLRPAYVVPMTSCLTSTQKESTPMRTTSRLIRTVLVAAGLLAISASAAQAMPIRQSTYTTDSAAAAAASRTIVFHRTGFLLDNKLPIQQVKDVSVMQPAADSPTNQALVSVMQP